MIYVFEERLDEVISLCKDDFSLVLNKDVLKNRTIEEQIKLMKKYKSKISQNFINDVLKSGDKTIIIEFLKGLKQVNIEDICLDENYVLKYTPESDKKDKN